MRARRTFSTTINAQAATTSWRFDDVDCLIIMVVYFEFRNAAPKRFSNFSQIIITTEHCCFLVAAALAGTHRQAARTVDFDNFRVLVLWQTWCLDSHVKAMTRTNAAATAEIELLFRYSDLLLVAVILWVIIQCSIIIFEVGFGYAADAFLTPTSSGMPNFHLLALC